MRLTMPLAALLLAAALAPAAGAVALDPLCPDLGQRQVGWCASVRTDDGLAAKLRTGVGDAGGLRVGASALVGPQGLPAVACVSAGLGPRGPFVTLVAGAADPDGDGVPQPLLGFLPTTRGPLC